MSITTDNVFVSGNKKMRSIWLCILALEGIAISLGEGILYPRESETRQVTTLDGVWRFRVTNDSLRGFRERWFSQPLADVSNHLLHIHNFWVTRNF
jgi:hypothetical protein